MPYDQTLADRKTALQAGAAALTNLSMRLGAIGKAPESGPDPLGAVLDDLQSAGQALALHVSKPAPAIVVDTPADEPAAPSHPQARTGRR